MAHIGDSFTVATWNLNQQASPEEIANTVGALRPQLLHLVEVDLTTGTLPAITEALGSEYDNFTTPQAGSPRDSLVTIAHESLDLRNPQAIAIGLGQSALLSTITGPEGTITSVTVHGTWIAPALRRRQIKAVLTHPRVASAKRVIIAGDLNSELVSRDTRPNRLGRLLFAHGFDVSISTNEPFNTFPTPGGFQNLPLGERLGWRAVGTALFGGVVDSARFDHVITRGLSNYSRSETRFGGDESDHYGIAVQLQAGARSRSNDRSRLYVAS